MWGRDSCEEEEMDKELPCEPAGHGEIATGNVSICSPFWRTFVHGSMVMQWIEYGYRLLWTIELARRLASLTGTVLRCTSHGDKSRNSYTRHYMP